MTNNRKGANPMTTTRTVYTVIVKDGEVCDRDLRAIAPAIRHQCGHEHRSYDTAAHCQVKLRDERYDRNGSWTASATWYNSTIHEHAPGNMDYIDDDQEGCGE